MKKKGSKGEKKVLVGVVEGEEEKKTLSTRKKNCFSNPAHGKYAESPSQFLCALIVPRGTPVSSSASCLRISVAAVVEIVSSRIW